MRSCFNSFAFLLVKDHVVKEEAEPCTILHGVVCVHEHVRSRDNDSPISVDVRRTDDACKHDGASAGATAYAQGRQY